MATQTFYNKHIKQRKYLTDPKKSIQSFPGRLSLNSLDLLTSDTFSYSKDIIKKKDNV